MPYLYFMKKSTAKTFKVRTQAIHAGEMQGSDSNVPVPNITMSTTFLVDPDVSFSAEDLDENSPFIYSRWGNPTTAVLERKVASLENGEAALAFSSGIAAVTGLMMQQLKSGDRVLVSDIAYAGVREFGNDLLSGLGIEVVPVNMSRLDQVEAALQQATKLVFIETPCNPIVRLTDIRQVAGLVHEHGASLAVDSTFASPITTRPLDLGADYVIHSMTKYLGGHGDAIGGVVVGRKEEVQQLRHRVSIHLGAIISPFNAWLINRGLATLPLRMRAHSENALRVARFLESHPRVKRVIYPGLESHPQHDLAKSQMNLFSGMLCFQAEEPQALIGRMSKKLQIFHYAVSLGHHKSLIFYIPTREIQQSSFRLGSENLTDYREYAGDGVFRVSIGLEDPEDLCNDLDNVL